jgi:metallo-beta-lactamase class B
MSLLAAALVLAAAATPPAAAPCTDTSAWTAPAEPFPIHGGTWYVGSCGLTALLVTSPAGHVLIDGTMGENAGLILANIRKAGFDPRDVRFIVFSHAHFDHVGGIAALQAATGARVLGRGADGRALRLGHGGPGDPQAASIRPFTPVPGTRIIGDGAVVRLGPLALHAVPNPGHTPGGTSWRWRSCERGQCRTLVYADSLSALAAPGWRFRDHPAIVAALRGSIARLAAQPCDILLTPHPSVSAMWTRFGPTASVDPARPGQCRSLAEASAAALSARLAEEDKPR